MPSSDQPWSLGDSLVVSGEFVSVCFGASSSVGSILEASQELEDRVRLWERILIIGSPSPPYILISGHLFTLEV